eukprot:6679036-Prymnesium_polylepis.1
MALGRPCQPPQVPLQATLSTFIRRPDAWFVCVKTTLPDPPSLAPRHKAGVRQVIFTSTVGFQLSHRGTAPHRVCPVRRLR